MDVAGISPPATTDGVRTEKYCVRVPSQLFKLLDRLKKEERILDEEIHEPAKRESSHDHDQEEGEAVADLRFFLVSSNQGQNGRDKS